MADGSFENPLLFGCETRREPGEEPLCEQQLRPQQRMIHRPRVGKRVVTPHLLKPADIMQHAAQPRELRLLHPRRRRDPFTQPRHAGGMRNFQLNFGVRDVILGCIGQKSPLDPPAVNHPATPFRAGMPRAGLMNLPEIKRPVHAAHIHGKQAVRPVFIRVKNAVVRDVPVKDHIHHQRTFRRQGCLAVFDFI